MSADRVPAICRTLLDAFPIVGYPVQARGCEPWGSEVLIEADSPARRLLDDRPKHLQRLVWRDVVGSSRAATDPLTVAEHILMMWRVQPDRWGGVQA